MKNMSWQKCALRKPKSITPHTTTNFVSKQMFREKLNFIFQKIHQIFIITNWGGKKPLDVCLQ